MASTTTVPSKTTPPPPGTTTTGEAGEMMGDASKTTGCNEARLVIGVLALQGAFEEHQKCLEAVGCQTRQVRTPAQLQGLHGLVLPGGESTAMGLIGSTGGMWKALQSFIINDRKPTWGTCAGMILLADRCVGTSAVIENGQALIGGLDMLVCRNYFGSQVSSFEMDTPPPPPPPSPTLSHGLSCHANRRQYNANTDSFPGVFIRAPAILNAGSDIQILGKVVATPCRQAAVTLRELEKKIINGEDVVMMGVVDALERKSSREIGYIAVRGRDESIINGNESLGDRGLNDAEEEKKEVTVLEEAEQYKIELPGAADGTNAREVICAVRKDNVLCTAFHPELTDDYRWHEYFVENMVRPSLSF